MGGILVEKNVGDVIPSVQSNMDGIVSIMKSLALQYKKKEEDLDAFQTKWNIKVKV